MSHGHAYGYQRGCELCRAEAAQAKRELRARKRRLTPVPSVAGGENSPLGPVVAAVHADLATLGDLTGWGYLAEGALAMARILDSEGNVPTHPAAAKQLASAMGALRREAAPPKRRLTRVQAMSERGDAG